MNSYKIKSITEALVTVEWTIGGKVTTDKLDARYLPISDAEALNAELQRQLAVMSADAVVIEIPNEVVALVNVKVDLVEPAVTE